MTYKNNITESPTFCPAPWTSLNINQIGLVLPCMASGFELGNVKQKNIIEILKDEPIRSMKEAQIHGEWHPGCVECQNREKYSQSPRNKWNTSPHTLKKIVNDVDNFFEPEHITINWSNLCNLACTYCNAETSTAWQSYKKIPIDYIQNEHAALIDLVSQNKQSLKGLTLGGGEPLLQKTLVNFLQAIDPVNVNVVVTTNLSVDLTTNDVYQILRTWPNVTWMISFDSVNKQKFEYIRHGANWDEFCKNIDTLTHDNQLILAHPAYSVYCALDLEEYYEFCYNKNLDIFWCDLVHPHALDIRRQNETLRKLAIEQIDIVIAKYSDKISGMFYTLDRYRQQLVDPVHEIAMESDLNTFNSKIEQQLKKTVTFAELWPNIHSLL